MKTLLMDVFIAFGLFYILFKFYEMYVTLFMYSNFVQDHV